MPSTQPYTSLAYAFKITSSRSVGVNKPADAINTTVQAASGVLVNGASLGNILKKVIPGTVGIEIYSLQGKRILRYIFNNGRNNIDLKNINKNITSQIYYARYIGDVNVK
jgi:hypothetical protein